MPSLAGTNIEEDISASRRLVQPVQDDDDPSDDNLIVYSRFGRLRIATIDRR